MILCNQISPVDYSPTGVAAAAADGPNLGCCDVSRKLKTISIKIRLGLLQDESNQQLLFYHNQGMVGYLAIKEELQVEEQSCA